jgi:hypothetical protein
MFDRPYPRAADHDPGFAARWTAEPPRFVPWGDDTAADPAPPPTSATPEASLWDAAFAAGHAAALLEADTSAQAAQRLAQALDRLAPMPPAELADALAAQVRALVRQLIGTAPVDETLLLARCQELAAEASEAASAVLHAHPDDAALLARADCPVPIQPDPGLSRGELRLCDGPGEIATGPQTMLDSWTLASC